MRYKNIHETKKLIKGIAVYGMGFQPEEIFVVDKETVSYSTKKYKTLINALKKMYKRLRCDMI